MKEKVRIETMSANPVLTALVPPCAEIGVPSFVLHVRGTGFLPDDIIVFNGFDEPTTYVSDTEVTTGINMDVWGGPSLPLPVKVRTALGAESNELPFTFVAAAPPLQPGELPEGFFHPDQVTQAENQQHVEEEGYPEKLVV